MRITVALALMLFSQMHVFAQGGPLTVSPGLTIQSTATPWALEEYQGKMQLVPVHHSTVEVNHHNGANFAGALVGSVFYKPKMTTELSGAHARTHLHSTTPVFYFFLDNEDDPAGDSAKSNTATLGISAAVMSKDRRIFTRMRMTQFTGGAKRDDGLVEAKLEPVERGWMRLTPIKPLRSGEYAISPIFKNERTYSTIVFDFSVDPSSANSPDAVRATE